MGDEEKQAAEDAKRAEEQRIADLVNKAAADHAKRAVAKFDKALEERDQKIAQLEARLAKEPADKETPAAVSTPAADPRLAEMEARIRASEKKVEDERKAREAERAARLRDEEKSATVAALTAAEITGELQEGALLVLQAQGRIGRDEAGKVCWLDQKEGYVDKVPVAEGVKKWATEGAGKAYLPARGVGGSGTKTVPGAKTTVAGNKHERVASAKKDLVAAFFGNGTSS
jgi:hypothetical protein